MFASRVHSWVLVRPGKRDVQEPFFIEPALGTVFSVSDPHYHGIECIWNATNYWVNMQEVPLFVR